MFHVVSSCGVLPKHHVFFQLVDQFLRSVLHLCAHDLGGRVCEWPALSAFMQTMLFNFGQSCIYLLTGLGNVDYGKHVFLPAPDCFARHYITHFSVRSLQALSPAPQLKPSPDVVDVLNFQDAVRQKAHVQLPFFHSHAVCLAGDEMQLKAGL